MILNDNQIAFLIQLDELIADGRGRQDTEVGEDERDIEWRRVVHERMSLLEVVELVALLRVFVGVRQVSLVQWVQPGEFEALGQHVERLLHLLGTEGHCVSTDSVDDAARFHHTLSAYQYKVDGLHDVTD